jgi:transcriptional regulator with XRE-family HTH domain
MTETHDATPSPTQALIKRLRLRGLSQTEISRRTQIPQPRLSRWESGDVAAGADDALKLQALEQELDGAKTQEG